MENKIKIITVMSELGAGTRGASLGFGALVGAGHAKNNPLLSKYPVLRVPTLNRYLYEGPETKSARRIEGIVKMFGRIEAAVSEVTDEGSFPILISGDHSNAGGTIAGLRESYPNQRIGVVWIDAHADLHSPYTSPSGNVHGMPLATALSEDNKDCAFVEVTKEGKKRWNKLKGANGARIRWEDLAFVSVRDTEDPEDHLISKNAVVNHTTDDVRNKGVEQIASEILKQLEPCDIIYVSFDVDSMDPSVSVGTGTPVPHGLWKEEAMQLIEHLVASPKCACFEMVEINPLLDDKGNAMAEAAFDILENTLETLQKRFK